MDEKTKDENLQKELDLEFRKILRVIKPYIPCIMNNEHLFSYRMWLEKLSEAELSEKVERNKYLVELCNQIQDGVLERPFDKLPVQGPLKPFEGRKESYLNIPLKAIKNKIEANVSLHENLHKLSTSSAAMLPPVTPSREQRLYNEVNKQFSKAELEVVSDNGEVRQGALPDLDEFAGLERRPSLIPKAIGKSNVIFEKCTNEFLLGKRQKSVPFQGITNIEVNVEPVEEDGSWYDLSDVSCSTISKLGGGELSLTPPRHFPEILELNETIEEEVPESNDEEVYEHNNGEVHGSNGEEVQQTKILDMMNVIVKLQDQNHNLGQNLAKYEHLNTRSVSAETSMLGLKEAVQFLQNQVKNLSEEKADIKKERGCSKLQNIIVDLNKKLRLTREKNQSLTIKIEELEKKIEEFTAQKQKDMTALQEELTESHGKTIKLLKQHHAGQLRSMENRFVNALAIKDEEITDEIISLKSLYEKKMNEIAKDCEEVLLSKNKEIEKLEEMVDSQCKKMQEEVQQLKNRIGLGSNGDCNAEKVLFLKKCIERMDKLFKKSEKEHTNQIYALKREIIIRDKSLQLQLISHKSERLSNTTSTKQKELDDLVTQLEKRYRKMLEEQHSLFFAEKERDAKIIADLRASVLSNSSINT